MAEKYRLVTRSDFDGLVCAMILKELDLIDDIKFVHPKDMQDGIIPVTNRDITTNLPFVDGVHLAFDHHSSEVLDDSADAARAGNAGVVAWHGEDRKPSHIIEGDAPSTARIVYQYYGGREKLSRISEEIMAAVDKSDTAQFGLDEILNPAGWTLLSFIMDSRTGLGRFHDFRISNYDLMMKLIDYCLEHPVEEVLELPDVKERVDLYFRQQHDFKAQLKRVTKMVGDVAVVYLKDEDIIYTGNRFLVYALFPQAKISVHVMWGLRRRTTAVAIGKSIVDRSSDVDIGALCHYYGGGGHRNAGTCQFPNDEVDGILPDILDLLNGKVTLEGLDRKGPKF